MNLDIEEIKHAEKSQKMYQEFLIYVNTKMLSLIVMNQKI